ncbi:MAG: D-amino-acid transaminase [Alphaproteobacteria bacterium]|nr:D-amino-acid transaminase [Alphaproteobacteria bacterium]
MARIAYVNGRYVAHRKAAVHVEDRGYQFADGVYEVIAVRAGRFIDAEPHLDRLDRSLGALRIATPMSRSALYHILHEVMYRNRIENGIVYLQVTRGVARRDHPFPAKAKTALVVTGSRKSPLDSRILETGVNAISVLDNRWKHCNIKSISLLPNVLAKQAAREADAYEAVFVDEEGFVTEGSSTNVWIVTSGGELLTRELDHGILAGVTRETVSKLAEHLRLAFAERRFTLEEARGAREAFVTSATSCVTPVVRIDEAIIGNGEPGSTARALFEAYARYMEGGDAAA